ncbi:MAG: class I SAM-dependent methyltransferase [Acidobacteriota bacterium]|jgi:hypothetical protein|nr:class I SAM-dependent methyltransferase [Acidobacteriota bacterium]
MSKELLNPLEHPVCLDFPLWLEKTTWAEHIPFAIYIISAARPRIFVELGTFYGTSYFAFCQAVKTLNLDTKCYAVDTWKGDEHAGKIDNETLSNLETHNQAHYADFSRLLQTTFDNARENFADNSVDLLHIDGFHTYEAIRHDFQTWLPKMSELGIILFHDVNVREKDFGVWKFWDELCAEYKNFTFLHGHGLGVLSVGEAIPENLQNLFAADEYEIAAIRKFFQQYGSRIDPNRELYSHNFLEIQPKLFDKKRLKNAYQTFQNEGIGSLYKKVKSKIINNG